MAGIRHTTAHAFSWLLFLSGKVSKRQPLEMAIREHLANNGLEVVFYYPAPRSVKVTFRYGPNANAYWTVESILPDELQLQPEDKDDWLYGDLVHNQLPYVLRRIAS